MNSRERVFTTIKHQEADRVPIDFWEVDEVINKLKKHYDCSTKDEVLDIIDADLRYIEGPGYIGPELKIDSDGSQSDIWGVMRKTMNVGEGDQLTAYKNVTHHPLEHIESVEEASSYTHWPSADWYDYSSIEKQCDTYRDQERVVVFVGDRTNRIAQLKPYMYLRGIENAYMDLIINPDLFHFINSKIVGFYTEYLSRMIESSKGKIDIFMTGDDFGAQDNLLCSRDTWLEMLSPGFKKYLKMIKDTGAYTMHHSCGAVAPLINDMAESGLDILQAIQTESETMDPVKLKEEFGKTICFDGSISIQQNLVFGTPNDVKKEVQEKVAAFAPGGGFIIGTTHNIQGDAPLENILALINAYKECLSY